MPLLPVATFEWHELGTITGYHLLWEDYMKHLLKNCWDIIKHATHFSIRKFTFIIPILLIYNLQNEHSSVLSENWIPQESNFQGVYMVLVPMGCFMMGSSNEEIVTLSSQYRNLSAVFSNQEPQTRVCFDAPFWIDKYLITNKQFKQFNGSAAQEGFWTVDNRPRDSISWFEAQKFCVSRGARLSSEAEWEYAARGWNSLEYPWGNVWDPNNAIWSLYSGSEYPIDLSRQTADVGSRPKGVSWVGSMDMAGNLWEWTNSLYKPYPYDKNDGRENDNDTKSPRVIRGGSWRYSNFYLMSAYRIFEYPSAVDNQIGFRCVRSINWF